MRPKEKAIQLHKRFLLRLPFNKEVITENKYGSWSYDEEKLAKQHALVCVDEIIDTLSSDRIIYGSEYRYEESDYWQEVKQEIENL